MKSTEKLGYLFITPMAIVVFGVVLVPLVTALVLSLCNKTIGGPAVFIGLQNYRSLLGDPLFQRTALNSMVYAFSSVMGKFLLGMVIALVLNESFVGRGLARAILLLPWSLPSLVVVLTWRWMFTDVGGVLNHILQSTGIIHNPVSWLYDPRMAMLSVIIVNIWRGAPFFGISILAGLQSVDRQLYQAAEVDGANFLQKFRYITLPSVKAVTLIATLLSLIWTFNDFQIVWLLTRGGPVNSTHLFATLTYEISFLGTRLGNGIAVSVMILPVLAILLMMVTRMILGGRSNDN